MAASSASLRRCAAVTEGTAVREGTAGDGTGPPGIRPPAGTDGDIAPARPEAGRHAHDYSGRLSAAATSRCGYVGSPLQYTGPPGPAPGRITPGGTLARW